MRRSRLCLALLIVCQFGLHAQEPAASAPITILRPARVFDGDACTRAGPCASTAIASSGRAGGQRRRRPAPTLRRSAGADAAARAHRRALARPAASVQRDRLERPGAERAARPPHRARDNAPARHADGWLHDDPRSRHRGRGLRGRRAEAGDRAGHHSRPAHAGHDTRDRRDGQLRAEGLLARVEASRRAPRKRTADALVRVVRDQIGHGADWIKVYADYRWGPNGEAMPTFSWRR